MVSLQVMSQLFERAADLIEGRPCDELKLDDGATAIVATLTAVLHSR